MKIINAMEANYQFLVLNALSLTLFASPLLAELKYFPKDKDELLKLVKNEKIKLDEIDTSKIADMGYLFCETLGDFGYARIPLQTSQARKTQEQ